MALIGKIRNNSWLLIVLIGLGLGGFIFMDMFSGNKSVFGSQQFEVGNINGEKLDWNQFNRTEQILYGSSAGDVYNRRDVLWNYFVEQALVEDEAEAVGLGVSRDELLDLQFGDNSKLSPIMVSRFQDPNTRQVNRQQLNQFKTSIETGTGQVEDPQFRQFWAHQEKEIINERLKSKINGMVGKALYTPTFMVEMVHSDQNAQLDMAYVRIPFDEIDNGDVALTDADYTNYINENSALYETTEPTRQIEYAVFNVEPTEQDLTNLEAEVAKLVPDFSTTDNASAFAERYLGSMDPAYVKKTVLSPAIADTVANMQVGSVYGPYKEGNAYKAIKLVDKKTVPDSVRSRHILLRAANQIELGQAQRTADSLITVLKSNTTSFDSLAAQFGTDGTASLGGDLKFAAPGQMVKPFNDLIFFEAEPGEVNTVITQFGVHVVEVTDRKYENNDTGYQVACLNKPMIRSEVTQNALYDEILQFVSKTNNIEELRAAVNSRDDVEMETSPLLSRNDYVVGSLGSNQSSRDLIRWAFESGTSEGDVSSSIYAYQDPVQYHNNKYVVAAMKSAQDAGMPSVASLKDQVEQQVINLKKATLITEQVAGKDLAAVAGQYATQIDTARNVTFDARQVTGMGNEPKVIAKAFSMEANQVSEPILGNNGVYLIKPTRTAGATTPPNIAQVRQTTGSATRAQIGGLIFQDLKKTADITDNRSRFY
ncbi:MAG: peptidylprolyl isomerase [Saprospiraceae bacterium]